MSALFWPLFIDALVLGLHLLVPAREVDGYVRDPSTGAPLTYRLNGLRVFVVVIALWALTGRFGWIPWDLFYVERYWTAAGACAIGLVFAFGVVLTAPPTSGNFLAQLYLGRAENPQWLGRRVDAKMYLYLVGAIMLELNVLSSVAHHQLAHPEDVSPGILLYAALFTFFVSEYLYFEEVHLYTYDFLAERVGFKLGWGCLTFYPFFYCIGAWATAELPNPHLPTPVLILAGATFLGGWVLSRGANLQKFRFKTRPEAQFLGVKPVALALGEKKLLCSGFWSVSRHINYLGEILMALGLTIALGYPRHVLPWLYPLYYVALLVPRQIDDDARCTRKYGPLWQEYCQRVPYRIIPGIY